MNINYRSSRLSVIFVVFFIPWAGSAFTQQFASKKDLFPNFTVPISYPALSADGKDMVFVSDDELNKSAWESVYSGKQWSDPRPLEFINKLFMESSKTDAGGFSYNYNGSMLYFHSNQSGNYDIYYSTRAEGKWSEPKNMGPPVNSAANEYSPSLSPDGKTIFILRDKAISEKDKICKELVLYEKDKSGQWTGPQYLPAVFNSGCQETPFLCADNKTLLFASERPDTNSLGKKVDDDGYNIYFTKRLYGNAWYIPAYVDELSTEFNDLSPSMEYTGKLFCSNIKAQKAKKPPQKIFSTELPEKVNPGKTFLLKGAISDLNTKQPIDASIIAYNAITSVIEGEFSTAENGNYLIILNAGKDYKIDFFRQGYSHYYLNENTQRLTSNVTKELNVNLYSEINLDMNVFDNELFYPLTPKITITDSLNPIKNSILVEETAKGRYSSKLKIGKLYKLVFEAENFEPYISLFDLRTDVQYSSFEMDIELQVAKREIILNITDAISGGIIEADVVVRNLVRNEEASAHSKHNEQGKVVLALRNGDSYDLDVAKKAYTYFNIRIDINSNTVRELDIPLSPLNSTTKLIFNNVSFETNSAELNSNSFEELNRLAEFITENNEIVVEISAHTDDIGSDVYNNNLSLKRAQKVVDYLAGRNVDIIRLRSRGYGKTMPLVPNTSDANRAMNRRVELKIIDNTTPIQ
jgi:outer membrane protein OmpA-like peptidoglycan-associated protein